MSCQTGLCCCAGKRLFRTHSCGRISVPSRLVFSRDPRNPRLRSSPLRWVFKGEKARENREVTCFLIKTDLILSGLDSSVYRPWGRSTWGPFLLLFLPPPLHTSFFVFASCLSSCLPLISPSAQQHVRTWIRNISGSIFAPLTLPTPSNIPSCFVTHQPAALIIFFCCCG